MILPHINEIASLCAAHGIQQAVVSPGSRSAAISLAFENHPDIDVKVIADERSAAFIAMGMAQQQQKAVALICTSGSAVYNYAPAVAEAYYQEIPLLIITADRPPEWTNQYDGQTIQQEGIFGKHVKGSFSLPVDLTHSDAQWHSNRLVNEAILLTNGAPKGPVHLNVPIREPFYPTEGESFTYPKTRVMKSVSIEKHLSHSTWNELTEIWNKNTKRLLVIGQMDPNQKLSENLQTLKEKTGIPVLNEIIANQHGLEAAITKQDLFLQGNPPLDAPELLITMGKSMISKNLKIFLRKNPPKFHWHIHEGNRLNDALQHLSHSIDMRPEDFIAQLSEIGGKAEDSDFNKSWNEANNACVEKSYSFAENCDFGELKATSICLNNLPANSQLHLANSMSVRYANFLGISQKNIEIYCNRGTSGIDGSNGTAVGAALTSGKLVTLLTGDMAFLYDRNAFWHAYDLSNLRIIVLNNAGGGIFGMIKGPRSQAGYEKLFQTEQALTAKMTAKEYGFEYATAKNEEQLTDELKTFFKPSASAKILEVFSDPRENEKIFSAYKAYCLGL